MAIIRPAKPQDIVHTNNICIVTAADFLQKNEAMKRITCLLFNDYYLLEETEHCFVLDDGEGAVGYIICSADIKKFARHYRGDIFKQIVRLSPIWGAVSLFVPVKYVALKKHYPAHLHIDILPAYQSSGYGSALMKTLLKHLKESGVKGVCLSCGADNTKAIAFYHKFGFRKKCKAFGSLIMVKEL